MPKNKKSQETWLIQKGSVSFNIDLLRRGLREPDFVGVTRILGRLRGTEIKTSYNASQRFCFASVISLNDLDYLRVIEVRSFKHAIRIPKSNHCLNLRSIFHVEFATEKTLSGQFAKENL